ncbi:MAG: hypothetical protein WA655_03395 [Candidatus Korobacteraceae bacterium]
MPRIFLGGLFSLVLFAGPAAVVLQHPIEANAQQRSQRLILKDGSFQSVVKYEMQGDRVHYLSAERYEWEDIPSSLINWDATKKYNDELVSGKMRTRTVETPEEKEQREKEEANSPEIAPGLNLPGSGGVFLFDQFQSKPELAEIVQNGSELNKSPENKKKSVLRSAINPLASSKQAFEIQGQHAQIQSHVARPIIYIDIDEGPQSTAPSDRFRLVRAEVKKDTRVVGSVKVGMSGKVTEQNVFIPVDVTKLGTGEWLKLVPRQDLVAGEYAVVEMLDPQQMNLYVWDFGMNPGAPVNPNTWQPKSGN